MNIKHKSLLDRFSLPPWTCLPCRIKNHRGEDVGGMYEIFDKDGDSMGVDVVGVQESENNARLIEAAPYILDALLELYELLEFHQDEIDWYSYSNHHSANLAIILALDDYY